MYIFYFNTMKYLAFLFVILTTLDASDYLERCDADAAGSGGEPHLEAVVPEAIGRKIEGLAFGKHGYNADPASAKVFNETLVEKGDPKAINRKIDGLANGRYGYTRSIRSKNA